MNWKDRITVLAVNPDAATPDEVARLAAELMEARNGRRKAFDQAIAIANKYTLGSKPKLITLIAQHNTAASIAEEIGDVRDREQR